MTKHNAFYGQSGGPTAVINATAAGVIDAAQKSSRINNIYAGVDGIIGALHEQFIDLSREDEQGLASLIHTPAGAFGAGRYKLTREEEYERLLKVFAAHDIRYFFYNGGGDSQDTTLKLSQVAQDAGYPLTCVGIPKTIDNDLPLTDNSPGFGSAAKYIAVSTLEASYEMESVHRHSTRVFIMEGMGRHTGWLAAASCLARDERGLGPDLILLPEMEFHPDTFIKRIDQVIASKGFCVIVAAEGIRNTDGHFLSETGASDAFGHVQLGGVAPRLANLVRQRLSVKCHWAVCDYLQRAARHIASQTDVEQAYAVGAAAVEYALQDYSEIMPAIVRDSNNPYHWHLEPVPLSEVANKEKPVPSDFITPDGFGISSAGRAYLTPLIQGEAYPPYQNGLPAYGRLQKPLAARKLLELFSL